MRKVLGLAVTLALTTFPATGLDWDARVCTCQGARLTCDEYLPAAVSTENVPYRTNVDVGPCPLLAHDGGRGGRVTLSLSGEPPSPASESGLPGAPGPFWGRVHDALGVAAFVLTRLNHDGGLTPIQRQESRKVEEVRNVLRARASSLAAGRAASDADSKGVATAIASLLPSLDVKLASSAGALASLAAAAQKDAEAAEAAIPAGLESELETERTLLAAFSRSLQSGIQLALAQVPSALLPSGPSLLSLLRESQEDAFGGESRLSADISFENRLLDTCGACPPTTVRLAGEALGYAKQLATTFSQPAAGEVATALLLDASTLRLHAVGRLSGPIIAIIDGQSKLTRVSVPPFSAWPPTSLAGLCSAFSTRASAVQATATATLASLGPSAAPEHLASLRGVMSLLQGARGQYAEGKVGDAIETLELAEGLLRVGLGLTPVLSQAADLYAAITGIDPVSGVSLSNEERAVAAIAAITFGTGKAAPLIAQIVEGELPHLKRIVDTLAPSGRLIGSPGSSSAVRYVKGSVDDARAMYSHLTEGAKVIKDTGHVVVKRFPGDIDVIFRTKSSYPHLPTIQLKGIKGKGILGVREIKFEP